MLGIHIHEEDPIVLQRWGVEGDKLIRRFQAWVSPDGFMPGDKVEIRRGFSTETAARAWAERRLCEVRAARELYAVNQVEAAEMCEGALTG